MIERNILKQKIKEYQVKDFLETELFGAGFSKAEIKRTPLGEKIIVHTSRPGMVVGRSGKNIKDLTETLKTRFNLDNPQIEINEIKKTSLDANLMAEKIAISLQRFGSNRFKNIIHKAAEEIMRSGAKGVEILLSGKVPSARARRWRISQGYLKKCGEPALVNVDVSYKVAKIKAGVVGIIVKIMPPNVVLPDHMEIRIEEENEEVKDEEKNNDNKKEIKNGKKTVEKEEVKSEKKVKTEEVKNIGTEADVKEKTKEEVKSEKRVKTEEVKAEEVKNVGTEADVKTSENSDDVKEKKKGSDDSE